MTDDIEFISNVRALSENGTLAKVLEMLDAECHAAWAASPHHDERERAWYMLQAIRGLHSKIKSLTTDERVRQFNNRRILRSS